MTKQSESSHDHVATRRHRQITPKRSSVALFVAVGLFALSGCGSDPSKDAADAADTAAPDDAAVATTTKPTDIGVESPVATEPAPESATLPSTAPEPSTTAAASPSSVAAGDAQDPCRLISAAEAEAALGMPVQEAVKTGFDSQTYGHGSDCSYSGVDQAAGPTTVHVGVLGEGFPRELWEQSERVQEGLVEVPGLGDIAFFDENKSSIDAFVDGRWVQAQMINTNEAELLADLTEIVSRAIERL
jgi:hypothetical protein